MYVMFSGRYALFMDRGAGPQKFLEWSGSEVTGALPYSRLAVAPGNALAMESGEVLFVPKEHFRELTRECPELTAILVHRMLDRAREFTSTELQNEKMISLGRLSAGLAHELNNPAAAIERSASLLGRKLDDVEQAARSLSGCGLTQEQFDAVDAVRNACSVGPEHGVRSPLSRRSARRRSPTGSPTGVSTTPRPRRSPTRVSRSRRSTGSPPRSRARRSTRGGVGAAGCSVRRLASEIQDAATRIAGLVLAVKGFTHMDQATIAEPVDLSQSLANTVAVLKSKARAKAIAVSVKLEPGLPKVRGFAGELNQIWGNLIDNALDAVPEAGRVEVQAGRKDGKVVVSVADNGAGIPAEIRDRIFEPFFTTKPTGLGTGLGLDIVRRLVQHNDGEIEVESNPGRTVFQVALPPADDSKSRRE
jgi:signal transduction histidine kinase